VYSALPDSQNPPYTMSLEVSRHSFLFVVAGVVNSGVVCRRGRFLFSFHPFISSPLKICASHGNIQSFPLIYRDLHFGLYSFGFCSWLFCKTLICFQFHLSISIYDIFFSNSVLIFLNFFGFLFLNNCSFQFHPSIKKIIFIFYFYFGPFFIVLVYFVLLFNLLFFSISPSNKK